MTPCRHIWAELCVGAWGNHFTPYWRVYICVRCHAKQEVST